MQVTHCAHNSPPTYSSSTSYTSFAHYEIANDFGRARRDALFSFTFHIHSQDDVDGLLVHPVRDDALNKFVQCDMYTRDRGLPDVRGKIRDAHHR